MKAPDSRPRFQSSTRHYHRYREENRGGWNDWVGDPKNPQKSRRGKWWKWILSGFGILGIFALIGVAFYLVL